MTERDRLKLHAKLTAAPPSIVVCPACMDDARKHCIMCADTRRVHRSTALFYLDCLPLCDD